MNETSVPVRTTVQWLVPIVLVFSVVACSSAEAPATPSATSTTPETATTSDTGPAIELGITVYAGSGRGAFSGDGGPASDASVLSPTGLSLDADGNLYISSDNRVRKVDAESGVITTVVGTGSPGFAGDGGSAMQALIKAPEGLAVDREGNLYIADRNNGRIRKVDSVTGTITTVAGGGAPKRVGGILVPGDGGPATDAWIKETWGVAVDSRGDIYFTADNRIRKVDTQTGIITTLAGSGLMDLSGDGGPSWSAGVADPRGIAVDGRDNIYFVDSSNQRVRRIDAATGIIVTVAGIGKHPPQTGGTLGPPEGRGFSGDGGPAASAMLSDPSGVAIGPNGDLYIADTENDRIRVVDLESGVITTLADGGSIVGGQYTGDGVPGLESGDYEVTFKHFSPPADVAVDRNGNVFIADHKLNKVVRIAR